MMKNCDMKKVALGSIVAVSAVIAYSAAMAGTLHGRSHNSSRHEYTGEIGSSCLRLDYEKCQRLRYEKDFDTENQYRNYDQDEDQDQDQDEDQDQDPNQMAQPIL
ncbi:hypothetical protein M446_6999 (plasmid) [Methylobacterium sp. 4-46]|nr:hypothetical protein M446_6999 [Methylobacterium sp. 4-46]